MSRATITPKLVDVCPAYRRAIDDYREALAAWEANPCDPSGAVLVGAWRCVTQAASDFRKLKAVE